MIKIGILVGSLRKQSISKKFAENMRYFFPESYQSFREQIASIDSFLFITPEYNRSVPAVLKNALDVASRPPVKNAWSGKPAAIISHSPGTYGGFGANHHLRQVMTVINMPVLQQPEMYMARSAESFDTNGKIVNEKTNELLQSFVDSFVEFIQRHQ